MKPTKDQIVAEANRLANALGGAVNLTGSNLAFSVDAKFPDITDDEYDEVEIICNTVADDIRFNALSAMWADDTWEAACSSD